MSWKDLSPRLGAGLRPVRQREDGAQGEPQQVHGRAGPAGHLRRSGRPDRPPGEHGHAELERLACFRPAIRGRGNFVPDCDADESCSRTTNAGSCRTPTSAAPIPATTYDQRALVGWGVRPDNWEFSAERPARGGLARVDERRLLPPLVRQLHGDRQPAGRRRPTTVPFSVTAPTDPRLPDGGGYADHRPLRPEPEQGRAGRTTTSRWRATTASRSSTGTASTSRSTPGSGAASLLQGGLSTGRTMTDNCDVVAEGRQPEHALLPRRDVVPDAGQVPRLLHRAEGRTCRSAAPSRAFRVRRSGATYVATNAQVAPSLGRNLCRATPQNVSVALVEPGTMYGDRLNQVDLRFGKILEVRQDADGGQPGSLQRLQSEHRPDGEQQLRELAAAAVHLRRGWSRSASSSTSRPASQ